MTKLIMPGKDADDAEDSTTPLVIKVDERAPKSNYKPFDVKVDKWYKVTGKVIKKALKKAKSVNAIRDLSGVEE
jgi:hypothetical protein